MSTKSFTQVGKPRRQPTLEEIAAFEDTGRAIARERKITAREERRERRKAESSEGGNTESSGGGNTLAQEHGNPSLREGGQTDSREHGDTGPRIGANTETVISADAETQKVEPTVRLTIDLPESTHTRFKAACASTRRKMVDEVRGFIERRTQELEGSRSA